MKHDRPVLLMSSTVVLLLVALAFGAGCDDDDVPDPPTATSTRQPVTPSWEVTPEVMPPEPAKGYPWQERLAAGATHYVYDVETDTIQALLGHPAMNPVWLSHDELFVDLDWNYRVNLDGEITEFVDSEWLVITPVPTRDPTLSSTGWTADEYPAHDDDEGIVIVRDANRKIIYILSNARNPIWAANLPGFTLQGNLCAGWDQMWLAAGSGDLTNLTADEDAMAWSSISGPGTSATVVFLRPSDDVWWAVDVLDFGTRTLQRLFTVDAGGSFDAISWSPDGDRLLVYHTAGGKGFNCVGTPTTVERVSD